MIRLRALMMVLLLAGWPAAAAEMALPPGMVREELSLPISVNGRSLTLQAEVTRPDGPDRYPLALLSHGSPRQPSQRPRMTPQSLRSVAIEFARRGWAAVVVMRPGFGRSQGQDDEGYGSCERPDYVMGGRRTAGYIVQAARALGAMAWVDGARVLLVGVSAGGFGSVAAASSRLPGLVGVIDFAGGRGSLADNQVCRAELLVAAMGQFGAGAAVPVLGLFAENDHFFGPPLARRMFAAFHGAGGRGRLEITPASGQDGHSLITSGIPLWRPLVERFLTENGLPATPILITAAAGPRADLPPPPGLSDKGLAEFARYRANQSPQKAFAVGGQGGFGWRSGQPTAAAAAAAALAACRSHGHDCTLYAIGDQRADRP